MAVNQPPPPPVLCSNLYRSLHNILFYTLYSRLKVLALCSYPELMNDSTFPEDAKSRARHILQSCGGNSIGGYDCTSTVSFTYNQLLPFFVSFRVEVWFVGVLKLEAIRIVSTWISCRLLQRESRHRISASGCGPLHWAKGWRCAL